MNEFSEALSSQSGHYEYFTQYGGYDPDLERNIRGFADCLNSSWERVTFEFAKRKLPEQQFATLYQRLMYAPAENHGFTQQELFAQQFIRMYDTVFSDLLSASTPDLQQARLIPVAYHEAVSYAQFSQRLAQGIVTVIRKEQNSTSSMDRWLSLVLFTNVVSELERQDTYLGNTLAPWLRGAYAQALLYKALREEKFTVLMPSPEDEEQIFSWDVYGHVDLVAVKRIQGVWNIAYIDAKSNKGDSKVYLKKTEIHEQATLATHRIAYDVYTRLQQLFEKQAKKGTGFNVDEELQRLLKGRVFKADIAVSTHLPELTDCGDFIPYHSSQSIPHQMLKLFQSQKASLFESQFLPPEISGDI